VSQVKKLVRDILVFLGIFGICASIFLNVYQYYTRPVCEVCEVIECEECPSCVECVCPEFVCDECSECEECDYSEYKRLKVEERKRELIREEEVVELEEDYDCTRVTCPEEYDYCRVFIGWGKIGAGSWYTLKSGELLSKKYATGCEIIGKKF